jgi:mRNA-degrading endonuclease RelE of RelBE toxin-antitoxin system
MRYKITFAPEAVDDFKHLSARERTIIRDAIEIHLRHEPGKISKGRIKRLRGMSRPHYRLRMGELRVFYDVSASEVEILAIVPKSRALGWLERYGEKNEDNSTIGN